MSAGNSFGATAVDGPALAVGARLCFVADGRSPIARNWVRHFTQRGDEVHLISTFPCDAGDLGVASLHVVPVAFGALAGGASERTSAPVRQPVTSRVKGRVLRTVFPSAFGWLAPVDLWRHVGRLRAIVRALAPDLVHAMRVPYEGILAALALDDVAVPFVLSTWGNDLELWAARYPLVGRLARRALGRATALHPDCMRDLELARSWGWDARRPSAVIPGNGGVRRDVFRSGPPNAATLEQYDVPTDRPLVLNARGFRGYVRNDTFFRAVPLVLARHPDAVFAGAAMRGHPDGLRWVHALGIGASVRLLPAVTPGELADLFRAATAAVSPAEYDGTPNTLLEAMACGALPVAGDIASVREWVDDGRNGLLFDPGSPRALADALVRALDDAPLRAAAAAHNGALVRARADYADGMRRAESLYARALAAVPAAAAA